MINVQCDKDEWLILPSYGLWDFLSNEFMREVVRKCLLGQPYRSYNVLQEKGQDDSPSVVVAEKYGDCARYPSYHSYGGFEEMTT